jgi:hypothetical protein
MKTPPNLNHISLAIITIVLYSHFLLNPILKLLSNEYLGYDNCRRPNISCNNNQTLTCLGLPSGHVQTITTICLILYFYDLVSLTMIIIMILLVSLHRVITNVHSIVQVCAGIFVGCISAILLIASKLSYKSVLTNIIILLLCIIGIVFKLDTKLNSPAPEWVSDKHFVLINVPYYKKVLAIMSCLLNHRHQLTIGWDQLENNMNNLLDTLEHQKFDCIVGINVGGVIMSDFFAKKMQIPNYKINDIMDKRKKIDLSGKKIVLVTNKINSDEQIVEVINYFKNEHNVDSILTVAISAKKNTYQFECLSSQENIIVVWPWGYEN